MVDATVIACRLRKHTTAFVCTWCSNNLYKKMNNLFGCVTSYSCSVKYPKLLNALSSVVCVCCRGTVPQCLTGEWLQFGRVKKHPLAYGTMVWIFCLLALFVRCLWVRKRGISGWTTKKWHGLWCLTALTSHYATFLGLLWGKCCCLRDAISNVSSGRENEELRCTVSCLAHLGWRDWTYNSWNRYVLAYSLGHWK